MNRQPDDTLEVAALGSPVEAVVAVPGSKSIANRALICASLARGTSTLSNLPDGDDVTAMIAALGALGSEVVRNRDPDAEDSNDRHGDGGPGVDTDAVTIAGWGGGPPTGNRVVDCQLAGTTSRFLVALAATCAEPIVIDGVGPLRSRPFAPLLGALSSLGATVRHLDDTVLPVEITGPIEGGAVVLRGDVSSQFISALMMIGPVLPRGLEIEIEGELVSRPYVELTAGIMRSFQAAVRVEGQRIVVAPGGYAAHDLFVEPDASSASYPLAIAATVGGQVTVPGLGAESLQGDAVFAQLLGRMGCEVQIDLGSTTVQRRPGSALNGIDIDMADISDLVPTLAAVAAFASSETSISGVGFIRLKESDRLGDLAHEWTKLGIDITETDDGLRISPSEATLKPGLVDTHHDHRVAMSSAVIGVVNGGVTVASPTVVSKSWPGFWSMIEDLRSA